MMIDTNVYLSRWPFRRLPCDTPQKLIERLRRHRISQAWAGSFDGLLHDDLAAVNSRLAAECAANGELLVPFGSINPKLPDWEEDLRRCREEHQMPGIRLHPNYHGYQLDDPLFAKLLKLAAAEKLVVQIALKMEDERTQHPLVQVESVHAEPLVAALAAAPGARVMILNGMRNLTPAMLERLSAAGNVSIRHLDAGRSRQLARLVDQVGIENVVFGSYFPQFYLEAAVLKLRESGLEPGAVRTIVYENARRIRS